MAPSSMFGAMLFAKPPAFAIGLKSSVRLSLDVSKAWPSWRDQMRPSSLPIDLLDLEEERVVVQVPSFWGES